MGERSHSLPSPPLFLRVLKRDRVYALSSQAMPTARTRERQRRSIFLLLPPQLEHPHIPNQIN
ncbi:hypothetical protein [Argonema galeatum]|uniref:hypothetical protein n=1 Tax=Argonema galeatum TaxID=2942762 RepID=UPI002012EBA4|nr:hypothetical protein [Argonema galeatum]MCL1463854.1 hypothetical protein [Argonema galeatum A003/A1]